jgi:two-component system chemotaxis response regulator CheB
MADTVRVLVVDDSAYMRVVLKDILESDGALTVLDTAKNGLEAVEKVKALAPDVVLLDIQMPKMDGLATLQRIMKDNPTRVVMLSAMDKLDDQLPLRALSMGAVDFISKPSGPVSIDIVRFKSKIVEIVRNAALARLEPLRKARAPLPHKLTAPPACMPRNSNWKAVVIGASTGGPRALETIFAALPGNLQVPMFIVQHLPGEFADSFAKRLDAARGPKVVVAKDGDRVTKGIAYLAPGGKHLVIESHSPAAPIIRLDDSEPVQYVKPSVDVLFESAANCFGDHTLGVVLTGMGSDGVRGSRTVKSSGGKVIVQDEASSVIFGMARGVVNAGAADLVLPLEDIPNEIIRFMEVK